MNRTTGILLGVIGLLGAGTLAAAPPASTPASKPAPPSALPELLIPADRVAIERFARSSNYFLREQLYFAKRHRIVKINFDVLERDGARFTVTPFDDLAVELQATRIDRSSPGGSVLWQGRILRPVVGPDLELELDDEQRDAELDLVNTVDLAYRWAVRDVRPALARVLAGDGAPVPRIANAAGAASSMKGAAMKMRVMTMSAAWNLEAVPTTLRIAEIDEDPRYHVVYEEDPSKLLVGPQRGERARRFHAFMSQLAQERSARHESER
jgi:hypothetical protein